MRKRLSLRVGVSVFVALNVVTGVLAYDPAHDGSYFSSILRVMICMTFLFVIEASILLFRSMLRSEPMVFPDGGRITWDFINRFGR